MQHAYKTIMSTPALIAMLVQQLVWQIWGEHTHLAGLVMFCRYFQQEPCAVTH